MHVLCIVHVYCAMYCVFQTYLLDSIFWSKWNLLMTLFLDSLVSRAFRFKNWGFSPKRFCFGRQNRAALVMFAQIVPKNKKSFLPIWHQSCAGQFDWSAPRALFGITTGTSVPDSKMFHLFQFPKVFLAADILIIPFLCVGRDHRYFWEGWVDVSRELGLGCSPRRVCQVIALSVNGPLKTKDMASF